MADPLFSPDFLRRLERLQLLARSVKAGSLAGERASPKRGRSVEFADYRNYTLGDDFRYIDWNVYGRLEKLFLKLFTEEEEMSVYILLDASASMGGGAPPKFDTARRLAGAIAFVALSGFDRVGLFPLAGTLGSPTGPLRGARQVFRVFDTLTNLRPAGGTDLPAALLQFLGRKDRPGLVIIISDFLQERDLTPSFRNLMAARHDLFLLQVLAPEEVHPDLSGDLRLLDVESGEGREVTVSDRLLAQYQEALAAHNARLEGFCRGAGAGYLLAGSEVPVETLVLETLRTARLLQ